MTTDRPKPNAALMRAALRLAPHPEGGWYRETWRDTPAAGGRDMPATGGRDTPAADGRDTPAADGRDTPAAAPRGSASAILFLLEAGERSAWHRVDAAEIWLWQGGGACALRIASPGGAIEELVLGPDVAVGQVLQAVVPAGCWQDAAPVGTDWVLAGCVVAPAFDFAGFEMAPDGWSPGEP